MLSRRKFKLWKLSSLGVLLLMLATTMLTTAQQGKDKPVVFFLPLIMQSDRADSHLGKQGRRLKLHSISGPELVVLASNRYFPVHVPPPTLNNRNTNSTQSVNFTVNYNPTDCGGTIAPWPANAQAAFNYATNIWSTLLNGVQTIEIDACWRTDLAATVLGQARAADLLRDFSNATQPQTWYAIALANQLYAGDLNGDVAEISASFNSKATWYFGLDQNPPRDRYDFASVVLHEIGHGLGFSSSMIVDDGVGNAECNGTNGVGCWGYGTSYPFIYDRFVENGASQALITQYNNNTVQLGSQLSSNNLFFDGAFTRSGNADSRAKLYAPKPWEQGSSVSHLDDAVYDGTPNAMMTHALGLGEAVHQPGAITLGILSDIGWPLALGEVYVDVNATEPEYGSSVRPFNTFVEGINAVRNNGIVWVQPGVYAEALTLRELEIRRPMELHSTGGTVTIGN
ncbi:MAG: hypothetical protein U0350_14540 [Caldilineaceae bacterium]